MAKSDNQDIKPDDQVSPTQSGPADDPKMVQFEDRVKSLEDQLKRALADYQNLEKRVAEGRAELASWGTTELLKKVLPVMDHLDKALTGMSDQDKKSGWAKGVQMAVAELRGVLKSEGLEQIEATGQFDPTLHEAVDMRDGENDKILEVLESGYRLNGKILRPTKVVVGKKELSDKNQAVSEEKGDS